MSTDTDGQCRYCRACIATGERWVRQKVFSTEFAGGGAMYERYHADVFAGEELSCWEKHELERERVRISQAA